MKITDVVNKSCLIGLSYFDAQGGLLKQSQLCGRVIMADAEEGISVELFAVATSDASGTAKLPIFKLPAELSAWFSAPKGNYSDPETGLSITDPDYLVTWDIHKTQDSTEDGQNEWWEWLPRTVPPQVGS